MNVSIVRKPNAPYNKPYIYLPTKRKAKTLYFVNNYSYECYLQRKKIKQIVKQLAEQKSIQNFLGGAK